MELDADVPSWSDAHEVGVLLFLVAVASRHAERVSGTSVLVAPDFPCVRARQSSVRIRHMLSALRRAWRSARLGLDPLRTDCALETIPG